MPIKIVELQSAHLFRLLHGQRDGSLPFGLTPRQHQAWLQFGGGRTLVDDVYDRFNVVAISAGNTGAQPLGWFRKEIKSFEDLKDLKMLSPALVVASVPSSVAFRNN